MSTHRRRHARAAAALATVLRRLARRLRVATTEAVAATTPTASRSGSWRTCPTASRRPRRSSTPSPKESGIEVKLVAVAEDQFNQLLTSNAAAGELPDVIGGAAARRRSAPSPPTSSSTPTPSPRCWTPRRGHLQRERAGADRGRRRPARRPERVVDPAAGLPARTCSTQAGLADPTTYDAVLAAAEELDSPDVAGFVGANIAGDAFTEQTFEHIGLGNDCQLVDEEGEVTFDSAECVEALDFYGELQQDYSVSGAQDVDTTRASYFAGQAAMIIWSTFILDEMAGLRNDALPTARSARRTRPSWPRTAAWSPRSRALGLRAGDVRRDHVVDDHRRGGDRPGHAVRRVHDERRLRAVDRHRPRGQGAGPGRRLAPARRTSPTPGRRCPSASTPRRRCRTSTARRSSTR